MAEIRMTNIGAQSVSIPWEWDRRTIYVGYCTDRLKTSTGGWLESTFALLFTAKDGATTTLIALPSLYAALDQPYTYRVLGPGESAVVKASAALLFTVPEVNALFARPTKLPHTFDVAAVYDLRSSQAGAYKEVRSAGKVSVTISGTGL